MVEYIDREQLLEHLQYLNNELPLVSEHDWGRALGYDEVIDEVKKYPSEDVQPVKHGRWINTMPNVEYKSFCQVKCSICESIEAYGNYCRNCGADMRGE